MLFQARIYRTLLAAEKYSFETAVTTVTKNTSHTELIVKKNCLWTIELNNEPLIQSMQHFACHGLHQACNATASSATVPPVTAHTHTLKHTHRPKSGPDRSSTQPPITPVAPTQGGNPCWSHLSTTEWPLHHRTHHQRVHPVVKGTAFPEHADALLCRTDREESGWRLGIKRTTD